MIQSIYKNIIALLTLLMAFQMVSFASSGSITIELENITPNTIEPGNDVLLDFRVYNSGDNYEDNIQMFLEYDRSVFELKSSNTNSKEMFDLCAECSRQDQYFFAINQNAKSGEYPIKVMVNRDNSFIEETFYISVTGVPDIIFSVQSITSDITPNSEFNIVLEVKNVGSGTANNIKLSSKNDEFIKKDNSILFIEELQAGESQIISENILTSAELETITQLMEFEIEYKDELAKEYTSSQGVGIEIIDRAELSLVSAKKPSNGITAKEDFDLTLRIENIGEGEANNVRIKVLNEEITGDTEVFVGSIDEGEDIPSILTLKSSKSGERTLNLEIVYEDDLGSHTLQEKVLISVESKGNSFVLFLILLALAGGGYYYYKKKNNS